MTRNPYPTTRRGSTSLGTSLYRAGMRPVQPPMVKARYGLPLCATLVGLSSIKKRCYQVHPFPQIGVPPQ